MMQDINSNVIITASSKGLGLAIAQKFSNNNHGVVLHGRDIKKIRNATRGLKNIIDVIQGDLREETTVRSIHECAIKHNISILVNNAAIPCYGLPLSQMSTDQISNSLITNLISPITLTHRLYSDLAKNDYGGVININSIIGLEPKRNRSIHSAAKWGLRGFSKSLRIEAKDADMRVMNVYPTRIRTVEEYTYGLDPELVADLIYKEFYNPNGLDELIIDGRPEEFRPQEKYKA
jgi:short-subunit dehydrogenase